MDEEGQVNPCPSSPRPSTHERGSAQLTVKANIRSDERQERFILMKTRVRARVR